MKHPRPVSKKKQAEIDKACEEVRATLAKINYSDMEKRVRLLLQVRELMKCRCSQCRYKVRTIYAYLKKCEQCENR